MAFESPTFETADLLLKRNWFVNTQDIHDLLRTTSNEVFWNIYHNRTQYSQRIREIIAPYDYIPNKAALKLKVADLTDLHLTNMAKKNRDEIKIMMKKEWEDHMRKHCPIRPNNSEIDHKIENQVQAIADIEKKRVTTDRLALRRFDKILAELKVTMDALEIERSKTDARWLENEEVRYHEQMLGMPDQNTSPN